MRTIKFRCKHFGKWYYGNIICRSSRKEDGSMVVIHNGIDNDKWIPLDNEDHCTVGQFTGICDKSGKEIYEGDVVSIGDQESVAVVIWHEHLCQFCYEFYKDKPQRRSDQKATLIYMMNEYDINVIGNIHDNPKLVPQWEF